MELTGQLLGITDLPHEQQLLTFKTAGGLYQLATGLQDHHSGVVDLINQTLTVTIVQSVRPSESGQTLVVDTLGSLRQAKETPDDKLVNALQEVDQLKDQQATLQATNDALQKENSNLKAQIERNANLAKETLAMASAKDDSDNDDDPKAGVDEFASSKRPPRKEVLSEEKQLVESESNEPTEETPKEETLTAKEAPDLAKLTATKLDDPMDLGVDIESTYEDQVSKILSDYENQASDVEDVDELIRDLKTKKDLNGHFDVNKEAEAEKHVQTRDFGDSDEITEKSDAEEANEVDDEDDATTNGYVGDDEADNSNDELDQEDAEADAYNAEDDSQEQDEMDLNF